MAPNMVRKQQCEPDRRSCRQDRKQRLLRKEENPERRSETAVRKLRIDEPELGNSGSGPQRR